MSLFDINDLKASINRGMASPNKYKVELKVPLLLRSIPYFKSAKLPEDYLSVMANSAQLPGRQLTTTKVYHRGHAFVIRGCTEFQNTFDVTFYNTPQMDIHKFFYDWMVAIDSENGLIDSLFPGNYLGARGVGAGYMTDMFLTQFTMSGQVGAKYRISYVFPIGIRDMNYSANEVNQVTSVTITFAYTNWERVN